MMRYGQNDFVASGESNAIIDIGAEMAQGISVPPFRIVKSISSIFIVENITSVRFIAAILTKIFMSQTIGVIFLEMRQRIW